jgi:hypothetical protein
MNFCHPNSPLPEGPVESTRNRKEPHHDPRVANPDSLSLMRPGGLDGQGPLAATNFVVGVVVA